MRIRFAGILLCGLVGDPSGAVPREVCRLQGHGDWGPIDAYSGPVAGCSDLGNDDFFLIDAGAEVRTVDDLVTDGVTPGLWIQVAGTWILDSADRRAGPGPLRVAVNGNASVGVTSNAGAEVRALGRVLAWGVDHAAAPVYRESPDTAAGTYARVGDVILCPDLAGDEDCAGSGSGRAARLRIVGAAGDPLWASYLARVTPEHRLCFFTPDDRRFSPPSQAAFCFEIVEVGPSHLDIDVRRSGGVDEAPYPDALRQHKGVQLGASLAPGERCFTTGDGIDADGERVGQWVQFESDGSPGRPHLVSVSEDEVGVGADRFCVADVAGVPEAHASGERVWFGWGIENGDPFYVDAPIVFESATGGDCDANIRLSGQLSLRGVSFRRQAAVHVMGPGTTLADCERLWIHAKRSPRGAQILFENVAAVSCRWLAATTGGDRLPECSQGGPPVDADVHGVQCRNCGSFELEDVGSAFGVDDLVYASTSGGASNAELVTGQRWNLGPMGSPAFSGQLFEGLGVRDLAVSDVVCLRCSSCDGAGALFFKPTSPATRSWQVDRITAIGTCGGLGTTEGGSQLEVRDATVVDARLRSGVLLPNRVVGGVFRGARDWQGGGVVGSTGIQRKDLVVRDNDVGALALWTLQPGEQVENVLLADNQCSSRSGVGGCAVLGDSALPADAVALWRLSFAQTLGIPSIGPSHQLRLVTAPWGARIGGLLFLGFDGPDAVAASDLTNAAAMGDPARFTWEAPLCHWANSPAGPSADNAAAYASGAVPGIFADPELLDGESGDFEPAPGGVADTAPCGIAGGVAGPGVRSRSWSLALVDLEPEFVGGALTECGDGLDDDGDGLIDHEDAGCDDARDASEGSSSLCDNGLDDDQDGFTDFAPDLDGDGIVDPPGDPGCRDPLGSLEDPQCQDGIDNDGAPGTDFDGGDSILGSGNGDPDGPDPQCNALPWTNREAQGRRRCGLGFELAVALGVLPALRRWRTGRR